MTNNYSNLLHQISNHIQLSSSDVDLITSLFVLKTYQKNEVLYQSDQSLNKLYFVNEGLLKKIYVNEDGKEFIIGFALENWWESDFEAFFHQGKTNTYLIAIEKTTVLEITNTNYSLLLQKHPAIMHFFLDKAYSGSIAFQNRIISTFTLDAEAKYLQLIKKYPEWIQRIPKKYLASYLGLSRETLSRFIKK